MAAAHAAAAFLNVRPPPLEEERPLRGDDVDGQATKTDEAGLRQMEHSRAWQNTNILHVPANTGA